MEKNSLLNQIWPMCTLLVLFSIMFGLVYPCLITLVNQSLFTEKSNGSLIVKNHKVIGSHLLGQQFINDKYFWSRPSAISIPYDAANSSGSNLGPANPILLTNVNKRISQLQPDLLAQSMTIPVDLVTSSASGLDPHISIAAANFQVSRVAKARNLDEKIIFELMEYAKENRQFGLLGEPRINVVELNISLDEISNL
jgi:K+-transporting ATPase ATPase C chain